MPLESRLIEQLLEFQQYHYDGRESSTTDIVYPQSLLLETPSPKVQRKTSHMQRNRLVMLEVALKFHEHLGTTTSKYPPAVILILMNHENFLTFRGISNRITCPYLFRPYQHNPKQMRHYIRVAHHRSLQTKNAKLYTLSIFRVS